MPTGALEHVRVLRRNQRGAAVGALESTFFGFGAILRLLSVVIFRVRSALGLSPVRRAIRIIRRTIGPIKWTVRIIWRIIWRGLLGLYGLKELYANA